MIHLAAVALILLVWTLPPAGCGVASLRLYDSYIQGPNYGDYSAGYYSLPPTQTSREFARGKPVPDCAVSWRLVALDLSGQPLPDICQPVMVSVDGQSWEGM